MGSAASRDVMSGTKTITLISSDNERFEVPQAAASLSRVIRNAIDNNGSAAAAGGIRMSKIPGKVLAKVLEYCNKHAAGAAVGSSGDVAASSGEAIENNEEELRSFDEEFIENVDRFMLYDLLLAAFYLKIQGLVDLASQKVSDRLEKKTVEMRTKIRIKDNYFPPPDEKDDDEKQWLFV